MRPAPPPDGLWVQLRSHVDSYAIPTGTLAKVMRLFYRTAAGGLAPMDDQHKSPDYVQLEVHIESAPSSYVWTPVVDFWDIWSARIQPGGVNRWNHLMGGA